MKIYALKDVKSGFCSALSLHKNDEVAKRSFNALVHDNQPTLVSTHPQDFELWNLGSFDLDTGIITPDLKCVATGTAIKSEL